MYSKAFLAGWLLGLTSLASAAVPQLVQRDSDCKNSATSRNCWSKGYNANTNFDEKFPDTGKTVKVNLEVSKKTLSPDGTPRLMQVFNGQYPGPTITADWGDTIQITVQNNLPDNGTSIHWHGIRQLHSNQMDGTNGITECPIAPGASRTYTFKATQYGTSWYHSHYSVQYGDGLVGTIQINGPATADYDIDLGTIPMTDWYHMPMFELLASHPPGPPTSQSLLVNGTGGATPGKIHFTPGKKHRLRVINTGINNDFHWGIDGHKLTVIAADFVPVKPWTTDSLVQTVGQRYDVIVEANQPTGNYVFRVGTGGGQCDGPNEQFNSSNSVGSIVSYDGAGDAAPIGTPLVLPIGCGEETAITPYMSTVVPKPKGDLTTFTLALDASAAGVFWKVNGQAIDIDWSTPSLSYVMNGTYNLPASDNGVVINSAGWVYYLIVNESPLPHPIHLHGHDFYIIATGNGTFTPDYKLDNPIRRDTHVVVGNFGVPGTGGYAVIAFQADNPGAWLMHCHIPFHVSGGLAIQFLERPSEIVGTLGDLSIYTEGCKAWKDFQGVSTSSTIPQPDSGLKKRARLVRRS